MNRPERLSREQMYWRLSALASAVRDGLEMTACIAIDSEIVRTSTGNQQMYNTWGVATTNGQQIY